MDFGELLTQKADAIVEQWVEAVVQDGQIEATNELTHKAVRNSLPRVLQAMATILSYSEVDDVQTLVNASLEHGIVRSEQGYEPAEIAREYRILRSVLFSALEPDLVQASSSEILRAVRLIDTVIDEAIARCFSSYTQGRLKELEQLQSQLKLTNQELTRLVQASKTNLSHLAHELKTPLTSIIGYSDTFLRQHRQTPAVKDTVPNLENIERVLQAGRQLLRLINDALEISRYEAGTIQLHLAWVNPQELLNTIIGMVEPLADAKQLQLQVNSDRAPTQILTDSLRLQQIVINLLSNAIRYTEAGSIQLACETISPNQWTITVTDSGIGITPADQNHIFEPYFRGNLVERLNQADGTGLGLAIVSRVVRLLQGQIEFHSKPGCGSTFVVTFPLQVELYRPGRDDSAKNNMPNEVNSPLDGGQNSQSR